MATSKKKTTPRRRTKEVTHTRADGTTTTIPMPPTSRGAKFTRRRPRGGVEKFTSTLKVKTTASMVEAVHRLADTRKQTPSELVREIIARELASTIHAMVDDALASVIRRNRREPRAPKGAA